MMELVFSRAAPQVLAGSNRDVLRGINDWISLLRDSQTKVGTARGEAATVYCKVFGKNTKLR